MYKVRNEKIIWGFFSIEIKNFQSSLKRDDLLVVSISSSEDWEGGILCTSSLFCSMKQYWQMIHSRDLTLLEPFVIFLLGNLLCACTHVSKWGCV